MIWCCAKKKKRWKQDENSSSSAFQSRNFLLKDFPWFLDDDKEVVNRAIFQINSFHCRPFPFPFFCGINYQPTPLFSDFHIKRTPELALKQENFKIALSSSAINENFPLRRIPRLPSEDCGSSFRVPSNFQKHNYLFYAIQNLLHFIWIILFQTRLCSTTPAAVAPATGTLCSASSTWLRGTIWRRRWTRTRPGIRWGTSSEVRMVEKLFDLSTRW